MSGTLSLLKSATATYAELPPVGKTAAARKSGVCPNAAAATAIVKLHVLTILFFIFFLDRISWHFSIAETRASSLWNTNKRDLTFGTFGKDNPGLGSKPARPRWPANPQYAAGDGRSLS